MVIMNVSNLSNSFPILLQIYFFNNELFSHGRANVDLDQVRAFRNKIASRAVQASEAIAFPRVRVDFTLKNDHYSQRLKPTRPIEVRYFSKVEEISLGPACYLFDYLRRSNQVSFMGTLFITDLTQILILIT